MTYKCEYFKIHELVPPKVYEQRGEKAWELMDDRILRTADLLREEFGAAIINNYKHGGDREWSGLRTSDSPWFSPYSQHSFGRAIDIIFKDVGADEVRQYILDNPKYFLLRYINAIELGTSWLHLDCRNTDRIKTFGS